MYSGVEISLNFNSDVEVEIVFVGLHIKSCNLSLRSIHHLYLNTNHNSMYCNLVINAIEYRTDTFDVVFPI